MRPLYFVCIECCLKFAAGPLIGVVPVAVKRGILIG